MSVDITVDIVYFTTGGKIEKLTDGTVSVQTTSPVGPGAEFLLRPDGRITVGANTLATQAYVDSKVGTGGGTTPTDPGTPAPVAWVFPSPLNGWGSHPVTTSEPRDRVSYRKVGNTLEFNGDLMSTGVTAPGTLMFTLPSGNRPATGVKTLLVAANGEAGVIKVYPNGNVIYAAGPVGGYVSLNGVSFPLD